MLSLRTTLAARRPARWSGCGEAIFTKKAGATFRFVEKGGKHHKVPVHHKAQDWVTGRFFAVAVGEGRVEEGS
jgi:hypothetical protein